MYGLRVKLSQLLGEDTVALHCWHTVKLTSSAFSSILLVTLSVTGTALSATLSAVLVMACTVESSLDCRENPPARCFSASRFLSPMTADWS